MQLGRETPVGLPLLTNFCKQAIRRRRDPPYPMGVRGHRLSDSLIDDAALMQRDDVEDLSCVTVIIHQGPVPCSPVQVLFISEIPPTTSQVGPEDQLSVRVKALLIRAVTKFSNEASDVIAMNFTEQFADSAIKVVVAG
jgi:hypothetical protein